MRYNPFWIKIGRDDFSVLLAKFLYELSPQITIKPQDLGTRGRRYELYFGKKHFFQIDALPGGDDKLKVEMVQTRLGVTIPDAANKIVTSFHKAGWSEVPMFLEQSEYFSRHLLLYENPHKIIVSEEEFKNYPPELRDISGDHLRVLPNGEYEYEGNINYYVEVSCPMDRELQDRLPPLPPIETIKLPKEIAKKTTAEAKKTGSITQPPEPVTIDYNRIGEIFIDKIKQIPQPVNPPVVETQPAPDVEGPALTTSLGRVTAFEKYKRSNPGTKITVEDGAEYIGCSKSLLEKDLRKIRGPKRVLKVEPKP